MSFWSNLAKIAGIAGPIIGAPFTGGASLLGLSAGSAAALGAGLTAAGSLGAMAGGRAKGRVDEAGINQSQDRNALEQYRAQIAAAGNQNDYNTSTANSRNNFDANATGQENDYNLGSASGANNFALGKGNLDLGIGDLELARQKFSLTAPQTRATTAVRGDILANARDASIGPVGKVQIPQISGGVRPSMFSDATRELGRTMSTDALAGQKAGDTFSPLPTSPTYQAPAGFVKPTYTAPAPYVQPPAAPGLTGLPQAGKLDSFLQSAGTIGSLLDLFKKPNQPYQLPGYGTKP